MRIYHIIICGLFGSSVDALCFVFDVRIRGQISRRTELQSHMLLVRTDWHTVVQRALLRTIWWAQSKWWTVKPGYEINRPRMWGELTSFMWSDFIWKWSEVSYGEVLVDKGAMYIRVTLYCGHLIILWLFHLGISCTVFVLICTVVVLYCFVMCVFVCVGFVMCVFVWVL
jgi:hypothetical protein